jgi:hypothetical protein
VRAIWTPEARARALKRAEQGMSYRDIACEFGTTKAAIAGLIHRLGRARLIKLQPYNALVELEKRLGWPEVMSGGCRYVCGCPAGFAGNGKWHWCSRQVAPGASFCPEHQAICYSVRVSGRGVMQ